jgi:hypothetical protein
MGLMGYIFPKVRSECPICKKNVFGEGLAWVLNLKFTNYIYLFFENYLNCYYCGTSLRVTFQKGKYVSEVYKK